MTARRHRDLIVIGASAGGFTLIKGLLAELMPGLGATVLVVLHRHPTARSALASVLARTSRLPVSEPGDGEVLRRDAVYVAPADRHMRVSDGSISIDRGAKQHHTRPAIDPLFVSASQSHGSRTIGVLLSGNLSDGVAGLVAIKACGGLSLVQDPNEAEWPSMPRNALFFDHVDFVFRAAVLPALLDALVRGKSMAEAVDLAMRGPTKATGRKRK